MAIRVYTAIMLWLLAGSLSLAATVKKVQKTAGVVEIDEGKKDGHKKGDKFCFFDQKSRKIACGILTVLGSKSSQVKVIQKKRVKYLRKGHLAEKQENQEPASATSAPVNAKRAKDEGAVLLRGFMMPLSLMPIAYQKINFLAPESSGGSALQDDPEATEEPDAAQEPIAETLWESVGKADRASLAFGAEAYVPSLFLTFGFHLEQYTPYSATADYNDGVSYVETTMQATSSGGYAAFTYPLALDKGKINLLLGLDMTSQSLTIDAEKIGSEGASLQDPAEEDKAASTADGIIYSVQSNVSVMSLLMGMRFDVEFNQLLLSGGVQGLLPVTVIGKSFSPEINDSTNEFTVEDPVFDFETSVAHGKQTFGVFVLLGAGLKF